MGVDYEKTFIFKRMEELRSRLSLIQTSYSHLENNFRNIWYKHIREGKTPPILYPQQFLKDVKSLLNQYEIELHRLIIYSNEGYMAYRLRNLSSKINKMQTLLKQLQSIQDQRISGLHTLKFLEYQPILQSEYSLVNKVYNAVDALSFDIMCSIFGSTMVKNTKYTPLTLFGDRYMMLSPFYVDRPGTLISIPYSDCFRMRFWASLAHEIAHARVTISLQLKDKLGKHIIEKMTPPIIESLLSNQTKDTEEIIMDYNRLNINIGEVVSELTSDFIGTYVCGPASLFAGITMLDSLSLGNEKNFYDAARMCDHPPVEVRAAGMQQVLESTGVATVYPHFDDLMTGVNRFYHNRNKCQQENLSDDYPKSQMDFDVFHLPSFIYDYIDAVNGTIPELLEVLEKMSLKEFNGDSWEGIVAKTGSGGFSELSPIELMNVVWLYCIDKDVKNSELSVPDFFFKRKTEEKIFEMMVNQMYGYYEKEVISIAKKYVSV